MSWKGDLMKAGILANGNDINLVRGKLMFDDGNVSTNLKPVAVVTKVAAYTMTATDCVSSRIFKVTPTAAINLTTPTALEIVAAIDDYEVGTWFDVVVVNLAAATHIITLVGGTDVTVVGVATIDPVTSATFRFVIDSATTVSAYRI